MNDTGRLMRLSGVHPEWHDILAEALSTLEPDYLQSLLRDDDWLPGRDRLLAAFRRNRSGLRYLLIGESPYPRRESANGIAFYDAAVGELWSEQGLSKSVNRATSLRNIVKAALLAEGHLRRDESGKLTQSAIAALDKRGLIRGLDELFANLQAAGFLMLNATPVLHPQRKPAREASYWQPFLEYLLGAIAETAGRPLTLVLWGKIAQRIEEMPTSTGYRKLACEHPYNVSFIDNPQMQRLFASVSVLVARSLNTAAAHSIP